MAAVLQALARAAPPLPAVEAVRAVLGMCGFASWLLLAAVVINGRAPWERGMPTTCALAGSRTRVTSMGGLYDAVTLLVLVMTSSRALSCVQQRNDESRALATRPQPAWAAMGGDRVRAASNGAWFADPRAEGSDRSRPGASRWVGSAPNRPRLLQDRATGRAGHRRGKHLGGRGARNATPRDTPRLDTSYTTQLACMPSSHKVGLHCCR